MKFIHAADLHLDSPLKGLERYEGAPAEDVREAPRRALENLVALAVEAAADFVLIAGDVYDGDWPDHGTGLFFARQMRLLAEAKIPVFLIRGNHDAASVITKSLRLPENVTLLSDKKAETRILESAGAAIHGQSFAGRSVPENLAQGYPAAVPGLFNIGMLHTSLTGYEGHDPYAPCSLADLKAKGYDYWALGHIHKREALSELPHIHFPGNIQGRHMGETGAKGCLLVEVVDDKAAVSFRELDVMRWERIMIDAATLDEALDAFDRNAQTLRDGADDRTLALRVTVTGGPALMAKYGGNPEGLRAELLNAANGIDEVWIEKTVLRAKIVEDIPLDGPLEDVHAVFADIASGALTIDAIAPELAALRTKLGDEGREAAPLLADEAELAREAYALLMARLAEGAGR